MTAIKRLRPKHNKKLDQIIHTVWGMMKNRCYNKNSPDYHNWGGRGITVCTKWLYYEGFLEDMVETYKKGLTLDRIDNNGNYCKENCRWATRATQNRNTRTNRMITYKGKTMPLTTWSYYAGLNPSTLRMRYYAYGYRDELLFSSLHKGKKL